MTIMVNTRFKFINKSKLGTVTTVMGLMGHVATYIQAGKIFYLQSSYAVSFVATVISFSSMIFWLIYGLEIKSKPLIICNIFGLMAALMVMFGIYIYGRNLW